MVGPDVTAGEIAAMCDRIPSRRQLVVDTTSASGGAIQTLERPGRAVVAATKIGHREERYCFRALLGGSPARPGSRHG